MLQAGSLARFLFDPLTELQSMQPKMTDITNYSVERLDAALEMEKWAEWAAQVSTAHSAHCSISGATSTLSTLYKH